MAAMDPLQNFIDNLARLGESLADPVVTSCIGPGLHTEMLYLLSACRQRFPDRWPGGQQPLAFPAPAAE